MYSRLDASVAFTRIFAPITACWLVETFSSITSISALTLLPYLPFVSTPVFCHKFIAPV